MAKKKIGSPQRGKKTKADADAQKPAKAKVASAEGGSANRQDSKRRARVIHQVLEREGTAAPKHAKVPEQVKSKARKRRRGERITAESQGSKTKRPGRRSAAAQKAARTRKS